MKNAFVIMTNTLSGETIGCLDENNVPVVFDTEDESWKEIADHKIEELQQFIDGERELEHTDFNCNEWVIPVTVQDDGALESEDGTVWEPGQERD